MALQCNLSLNVNTCVAGASPAPQATLTVYNPNATAVAVTAIQLAYYDAVTAVPVQAPVAPQMPAASPGQTISCPALSSITFGPMPVAVGSAASVNTFVLNQTAVVSGGVSVNPQPAHPAQSRILIGGTVYGSDGSANEIGRVALMVSFNPPPPTTYQGGYLQFSSPANFVTGIAMGAL